MTGGRREPTFQRDGHRRGSMTERRYGLAASDVHILTVAEFLRSHVDHCIVSPHPPARIHWNSAGLRSMMRRMRYGLFVPNFGSYAEPRAVASLAKDAEDARWDGFFLWDH